MVASYTHTRSSAIWALLSLLLTTQPVVANSSDEEPSTKAPLVRMHVVRRIGRHKGYSVDVRYPHFTGGSTDGTCKLNQAVKRTVDMNIPALPVPVDCFGDRCDFQACLVTPKFVSLHFHFDNDTGGAQGETADVMLNAQIYPKFKLLKLKDVLGRRVNYRALADLCLRDLKRKINGGEELSLSAGDLSPGVFTDFTLGKQGLTFILPEELLKPYGIVPEWTIEYKKLGRLKGKKSLAQEIAPH
jgi:hypothetical protein